MTTAFMDFLDNIGTDMETDDVLNDIEIVQEHTEYIKPTKTKRRKIKQTRTKKKTSGSTSQSVIESRIRKKLFNVGLNEHAISDIVDYVFEGVVDIKQSTPTPTQQHTENVTPKEDSLMSLAENILSADIFSTPTQSTNMLEDNTDNTNNNEQYFEAESIADTATSLLY